MMYGMYSFLSIGKTSQVDERFLAKTENAEVYFPLLAANYVTYGIILCRLSTLMER